MALLQALEKWTERCFVDHIRKKASSRSDFLGMMAASKTVLFAVAGELDPKFYGKEFVNILRKQIDNNQNFTANILFYKTYPKEEMIKEVRRENEDLVNLFLKPVYNGHLMLHWAQQRPRYHFRIVDNNVILEEKDHPPRGPRGYVIMYNDSNLVRKYQEYFYEMINSSVVKQLIPQDFTTKK